jgi:hypothetical protein
MARVLIYLFILFFFSLKAGAASLPASAVVERAMQGLKDLLTDELNRQSLPRSFVPVGGYEFVAPYPDRSYVFDVGALLCYASQDAKNWKKHIAPVVNAALALQNERGMWARSYDDHGIAEEGMYAGPAAVLARGMLSWGRALGAGTPEGRKVVEAAVKTADFLLEEINKIPVGRHYVIRQVTGSPVGGASPEENARVALFFMDLYRYFSDAGVRGKARKFLSASENILAAVSGLRGELYPFGFSENGTAIWEMPDREGVEGQCVMLQALYAYLTATRVPDRAVQVSTALENDFSRKYEILSWVEKTHRHIHIGFNALDGKKTVIPMGFSKKISPGQGPTPHFWVEFMARMALTYRYVFNNEKAYDQLLTGMVSLQQPSGFFPYAVGFNGYRKSPAWTVGADLQDLNFPFGSLIATVEFLFAVQNADDPAYAAPFVKFP